MKCLEHKNKYEVIFIEVKIPKEIRSHKESIFFGLSARQFVCAVLAVGLAAGTYLGLGGIVGKEAASWLCLLVAALTNAAIVQISDGKPVIDAKNFKLTKSEILCLVCGFLLLVVAAVVESNAVITRM